MTERLFAMLDVLGALEAPPADPDLLVATAPPVGTLPPPQGTWPLLGLLLYRQRLYWARRVIYQRLGPQLAHHLDRRPKGPAAVPNALSPTATAGIVPGMPDWEFCLCETDSYLQHRGTRERLLVDVVNGPDVIAEDGFIGHYQDRRDPGPAELRLRQLFPNGDGLRLVLDGVFLARGVVDCPIEGVFEVCPEALASVDAAAAFVSRLADPAQRPGLFAAIGDWPAAHDAAVALGRDDLAAKISPRAEACRQEWLGELRTFLAKTGLTPDVLRALAHAGAEDLAAHVESAMTKSSCNFAVMEVIAGDSSWCPRIYERLKRQVRDGDVDHEYAFYLARHGHRVREAIDHVLALQSRPWDLLIRLAGARAAGGLFAASAAFARTGQPADRRGGAVPPRHGLEPSPAASSPRAEQRPSRHRGVPDGVAGVPWPRGAGGGGSLGSGVPRRGTCARPRKPVLVPA